MTTISNHTDNTVIIYNESFSIKLLSNETVDIGDDILSENAELCFSYSGFTKMYKKREHGLEKGGVRKRVYYNYEIQSHFPIVTVLNIKNVSEVVLEFEEISLRKLLLFKTVYLRRILCTCTPIQPDKTRYMFSNQQDKKRFLRLMRFGSILTFPAALLAILIMLVELFSEDTVMEKIIILLFLLGFTSVAFEDFYFTVKANCWEIDEQNTKNTGDSSVS